MCGDASDIACTHHHDYYEFSLGMESLDNDSCPVAVYGDASDVHCTHHHDYYEFSLGMEILEIIERNFCLMTVDDEMSPPPQRRIVSPSTWRAWSCSSTTSA